MTGIVACVHFICEVCAHADIVWHAVLHSEVHFNLKCACMSYNTSLAKTSQRNMQVSLGLMAITMVRFAEVIRHAASVLSPNIAITPSF